MAAEAVEQKSFPYMSIAIWAKLRRAFFKNVPTKVTKNYLATAVQISEGTTRNVLPQLRNIGLIDKDGVPTTLAQEVRFDVSYAAACKSIVASLYPDDLRDLFPDQDADVESVSQWFMRHSGSSAATSTYQAKFYLHLVGGEPPADDVQPRAAKSKSTASANKPKPKVDISPDVAVESQAPAAAAPTAIPHLRGGPSLHIDMQVHIDPAASTEQIDAIFASMAKHLYGR